VIPPPVTSTLSASSSETFIHSQLCDTVSLPSLDKLGQMTGGGGGGDSSMSSNQNLSASISSDISFTDEENDANSIKVCARQVFFSNLELVFFLENKIT